MLYNCHYTCSVQRYITAVDRLVRYSRSGTKKNEIKNTSGPLNFPSSPRIVDITYLPFELLLTPCPPPLGRKKRYLLLKFWKVE